MAGKPGGRFNAPCVGNDRKRDQKIEKVSEEKVSKFDAKFLNDSIFARKSSQKDDVEDDLKEVFAMEKGASTDWIRGRTDRYIVSKIDLGKSVPGGDDTEIMVKQEPGERGSTHLEDDEVQFVGNSFSASLADAATRSSLKKVLDENMVLEVSLSRKKDAEVYIASLSPMDVADIMAWDDNEPTTLQSNDAAKPFAFTTPTKRRGPYNSMPLSPVTTGKLQFTLPHRQGIMSTQALSRAVRISQEGSSCADDESQQEWVRPRTMEELFALKRKQMDQKAKWSVNHALKNSRSV